MHTLHENGFSPVWLSEWRCNLDGVGKRLPQYKHSWRNLLLLEEFSKGFVCGNCALIVDDGKPGRAFDEAPLKDGDPADTKAKMDAFMLSVSKLFPISELVFPSPLVPLLLLLWPLTPPIYNKGGHT